MEKEGLTSWAIKEISCEISPPLLTRERSRLMAMSWLHTHSQGSNPPSAILMIWGKNKLSIPFIFITDVSFNPTTSSVTRVNVIPEMIKSKKNEKTEYIDTIYISYIIVPVLMFRGQKFKYFEKFKTPWILIWKLENEIWMINWRTIKLKICMLAYLFSIQYNLSYSLWLPTPPSPIPIAM